MTNASYPSGDTAADHLNPRARSRLITSVSASSSAQESPMKGGDTPLVPHPPISIGYHPLETADSGRSQNDAGAPISMSLLPGVAGVSPRVEHRPSERLNPAFIEMVHATRTSDLERDLPEEFRSFKTQKGKARGGKRAVIHEDFKGVGGFKNFLLAMGPKPGPGYKVDRYPERHGPYAAGNIRWASDTDQTRNRDCTLMVTLNGDERPLAQWCDELGLSYDTVHARIRELGWSPLEALLNRRLPKATSTGAVATLAPDYVANGWMKGIPAHVLAKWSEWYPAFRACFKNLNMTPQRREKLARIYLSKTVFTVCQLDRNIREQTSLLHHEGIDLHDPHIPDELLSRPEVHRFNEMHDLRRRAWKLLTPVQRAFAQDSLFSSPSMASFVRKLGWQPDNPRERQEEAEARYWLARWRLPLWWARTDVERDEWASTRAAWIAGGPAREAALVAREAVAAAAPAEDQARKASDQAKSRAKAAEYDRSRAAARAVINASAEVIRLSAVRAVRNAA